MKNTSKSKKAIGIAFAVIIAVSVFTSIAIPLSATEQNKVGIGSVLEKNQVEHDIEKFPLDEYILSTISEEPEFVPGEVIIKFKPRVSLNISMPTDEIATMGIKSIDILNKRYSVTSLEKVFKTAKKPAAKEIPALTNIYIHTLPKDADILSIVEEYQKDPNIEYAEPNYIRYTCVMPNDPYYLQQWTHQNMQSEQAWDIEKGDPNVVIAIVDSGVDWNHPDLAANIWSNSGEIAGNGIDDDGNGYIDDIRGWDFVDTTSTYCADLDCTDRDNDPMDNQGHGTHCAGISGAVTNNGVGVAGMAWDCRIMALRAGYKTTTGSGALENEDSAAAIVYAADNGADVISMSFGGGPFSNLERDAINYAYSQGAVLVGSAGNDNSRSSHYPSGFDNVIAVSATDSSDTKAVFSNYGSWVDVAAPGVLINSTVFDDSYVSMSGTSMSCPYVAGLVGLILSNNPSFTQEEVKSILHSTTDPVTSSEYIGIGRINAYKAIQVDSIPIANLNSSLDDANVYGTIDITGTASGDNFQNYTLEYGVGIYPTSWTEIASSTTPVTNGILATWSAIPGTFSIRLIVTDTTGQTSEDRVVINPQTKLYLCGHGQYLSEDPDTVDYYTTTVYSGSTSWDDYFLTGDINGTSYNYSYCLYLASESSTTFKIEIIINGTTVTSDTITVSYDPQYRQFSNELIGLDPITSDGDEVILKITKVSGDTGSVLYGAGVGSCIKVPPVVPEPINISEAVDNYELTWSTGGDADWFRQSGTYYYDGDAAESGDISSNQNTWMQTTVTGPGNLSFYWKASSETNYDYLGFYIDGVEQDNISGSTSWAQKTYSINSGTHILKWKYTKDSSVSSEEDCGWVDRVEYGAEGNPDIWVDPVSFEVTLLRNTSEDYTLKIGNDGNATITYNITDNSPWLDENPKTGLVEPSSCDDIVVSIDTTGLSAGKYSANIIIANNDPDENPTNVSVNLTICEPEPFDTGSGTYPSIFGTHNGTIMPNQTINVSKMYTYSCTGTGGHTEYVRIYGNGIDKNASWAGYSGDWHNLTFSASFTLEAGKTYNYTIITGSYPLIHHTPALPTTNGWINCTEFTDANDKEYTNWIPAIRLG